MWRTTYRLRASVLAASNVLRALLVDEVLGVEGDQVQDGNYNKSDFGTNYEDQSEAPYRSGSGHCSH